MPAVAVVPAAGSGERFGGGKLLADVDGEPLLERTLRSLLDGGVPSLVVVLGDEGSELHREVRALADLRVGVAINPDPSRGMFSSIQTGLAGVVGDPVLVLPADMPYVRPATVAELLREYERAPAIISPRFGGKRGHPVLLPGRLREEILAAHVDVTLHEVIRAHAAERRDVEVADRGILHDVDLPSDLGPAA